MVKKNDGKRSRGNPRRSRTPPPKRKRRTHLQESHVVKMTQDGRAVAIGRGRRVNLDHADILRFYNTRLQDSLNEEAFVDSRRTRKKRVWLVHRSCAHTLVRKYKRTSVHKCFKKFGKRLTCPQTGRQLDHPFPSRVSGGVPSRHP
jgi:Type II intron maturase